MQLTHTISIPELIWTALSFISLLYLSRLLGRSIYDRVWLRDEGINGYRQYSATTTIYIFAAMMFNQSIYVFIGLVAMMLPSPTGHVSPFTYVIMSGFIIGSAFKTAIAIIINKRKDTIISMLAEERSE